MSPVERLDAIIVGGGPAGSTLARALVRVGMRVALLDKRVFPRDKTCAGCITPTVVKTLALDLDEYRHGRVLQPIHGFRLAGMGAPLVENRHGPKPASYGIRRFEFDHYLLERCGAELHTGMAVGSLRREAGEWIVNESLRAPLLAGAGGHFCPVARALGADLGRGERVVGAQEFEVQLTPAQAACSGVRGDTPQFYFYPDLAGYAWIFRKGDWLNVGIGRKNPRRLSEHTEAFVTALARDGVLEPEVARSRPNGHAYLLYTQSARPLVAEGALLVGDAAGLAYPESGEGIRPAVESALLAGEAIAACRGDYSQRKLAAYADAIEARYGARRRAAPAADAPGALRRFAAALLLRTHWFTRDVVTRRWFLREHVAPLGSRGA